MEKFHSSLNSVKKAGFLFFVLYTVFHYNNAKLFVVCKKYAEKYWTVLLNFGCSEGIPSMFTHLQILMQIIQISVFKT